MKSLSFKWTKEQEYTFNLLKEKLILAPLLSLPDFTKAFEIECDTSDRGVQKNRLTEKTEKTREKLTEKTEPRWKTY